MMQKYVSIRGISLFVGTFISLLAMKLQIVDSIPRFILKNNNTQDYTTTVYWATFYFENRTGFTGINGSVSKKKNRKDMHQPGIEPGAPAWQASILPLNHWYFLETSNYCE